jgi:hypothetical protein
VLGARRNLWALDTSHKAANALLTPKTSLFAIRDFSTFPQSLWDLLWMAEREESAFTGFT